MLKTTILFILIFFISCQDSNEPYVLSDFKSYSGIETGYKIDTQIFRDNQSYLEVTLTNIEMDKLKKRFHFTSYENFLKSYYDPEKVPIELYNFNNRNNDYMYFIKNGNAYYEYFIICLSKKKNQIIFCENFRETSPSIF
jgi:hypothetical protein